METAIAEIKLHNMVLYDLISWIAHNDEYEEEEFTTILGAVYSFARSQNPTLDHEGDEGGSP